MENRNNTKNKFQNDIRMESFHLSLFFFKIGLFIYLIFLPFWTVKQYDYTKEYFVKKKIPPIKRVIFISL